MQHTLRENFLKDENLICRGSAIGAYFISRDYTAARGRNYCDMLFMWERKLKDLSPEERHEKRLEHEKPILEDFWKWLDRQHPTSGSRLDKAVTYARNQKRFMENYLLDGRIEISNQTSENAVRPFAVGRRNWLFSDSVDGAIASAAIYSLIQTAKMNDLRIMPYLTEILVCHN